MIVQEDVDLGLRFNSPFINLWMYPQDFIEYCSNIPHYLKQPLEFYEDDKALVDGKYPVGDLDGLKIFFQHYSTEDEARIFWERRSKRVSLNNLFVIANDRFTPMMILKNLMRYLLKIKLFLHIFH